MKYAAAPRFTGEICLPMLLFCLFFPGTPQIGLFAAFTSAVFACGLVSARLDQAALRLLCCLPAALLIPLARHPAAMILLAACWLYAAVRFAVGRFHVAYWACRREFAVLAGIALFASLFVGIARAYGVSAPGGVIGFSAALLLLGVFSLRILRFDGTVGAKWGAYSMLELLLPLGLAAGVSTLFWGFLRVCWYVLVWLFRPTESAPPPKAETAPFDMDYDRVIFSYRDPVGGKYVPDELFKDAPVPEPEAQDFLERFSPEQWLILLLAFLLLTAVIIIVLRHRHTKARKAAAAQETTAVGKRGGGKAGPLSASQQIREIYRSRLSDFRQQGQPIRPGDTSRDILDGAECLRMPEAEEDLRQLYLAARYGDEAALRPEDAQRARALLEQIRAAG